SYIADCCKLRLNLALHLQGLNCAWYSADHSLRLYFTAPRPHLAVSLIRPGPMSAAATLSVAQCCHTDALHCVFAFLPLWDVILAALSCRDWWAAALKERARGADMVLK